MRDRWYDPATGTFLSPDALGYNDSSNLYAFCGGDPVNCTDPTGFAGKKKPQTDTGRSIELVTQSFLDTFNAPFKLLTNENLKKAAAATKEFVVDTANMLTGDRKSVERWNKKVTKGSVAYGNATAAPGVAIGQTATALSHPVQFSNDVSRLLTQDEIRQAIASASGPTASISTIFTGIGVPQATMSLPRISTATIPDEAFVRFDPTKFDSSISELGMQSRFFADGKVWLTQYQYVKGVEDAALLETILYRQNLWPQVEGKFLDGATLRVVSNVEDAVPAGVTNKVNGVPQWRVTRDIAPADTQVVKKIK